MADMVLTKDHDIDLTKGISLTTSNQNSLAQRIKIALLLRTGEWKPNVNEGVPYSVAFLRTKNNKSFIDSFLQNYIINIDGVSEFTSFSSEVTNDRKYNMQFSVLSDGSQAEVEVQL